MEKSNLQVNIKNGVFEQSFKVIREKGAKKEKKYDEIKGRETKITDNFRDN